MAYSWRAFRNMVVSVVDGVGFRRDGSGLVWHVVVGELTWVVTLERLGRQACFDVRLWCAPSEWFAADFSNTHEAFPVQPMRLVSVSELDLRIELPGGDGVYWSVALDSNLDRHYIPDMSMDTLDNRRHDLELLFSALFAQVSRVGTREELNGLFHPPGSGGSVNWELVHHKMQNKIY